MTATKLPWYKRNPTKYLLATRDLTCEERGAYNDVLELLYERNRRVPDDARYLAGFIGLSQRRWKQIRQALLDAGKLRAVNGYLTNDEFETQRLQEEAESERFRTWGHEGGKRRAANEKKAREEAAKAKQEKLSFPDEIGGKPQPKGKPPLSGAIACSSDGEPPSIATLKRLQNDFISTSNREEVVFDEQKSNENNANSQAPLKLTRARRTGELENRESTTTLEDETRDDLLGATQRLTSAGGVSVIQPARLAREMDIVKSWRRDGIPEPTVLAVIDKRLGAMKPDETVSSLAYFDAAVRKAHSLDKRPKRNVESVEPVPDGADDRIPEWRAILQRKLGARTFDGWLKPTGWNVSDGDLVVTAPSAFMADWIRNHFVRDLAKVSGLSVSVKAQ